MENTNNIITSETPIQQIKTPITPEIPKSNLFKYLFIISIVVLLAVIISFVFILNKKQNTKTPSLTQPNNNISQITPTTNPTANWKTYTNATNGYSIKYPTDWIVRDDGDCKPSTSNREYICSQHIASYPYVKMSAPDMISGNPKDSPNGLIFSIQIFSNPQGLSLIDYVTGKDGLNHSGYNEQKISIEENDFLKEDASGAVSYYIEKNDKIFSLYGFFFNKNGQDMPKSESTKFQSDFDTMVSTFQFTK